MFDKRRINIYVFQEFVISMQPASNCLPPATVGYPNMRKSLLFLYVYISTLRPEYASLGFVLTRLNGRVWLNGPV